MSRNFTMVSPEIWSSPRFAAQDSDGKTLLLYFITGPHQNNSGCARVKEGYALADLGWDAKLYRAKRKGLHDAELIDVDGEEVYVQRWYEHCAPGNIKHARGIITNINKIESDRLREKVEAEFANTVWGKKALEEGHAANDPAPDTNRLTNTHFMRGGNRWS